MFCTNCGRKLDPEDVFCPGCGKKVEKESKGTQIPSGVIPKKRRSSKAWAWAILSLVVICGLALGGYFLWGKGSEGGSLKGSEGASLYPVVVNEEWGYIDKAGKIVINPQFDDAYNFFEGLASVGVGDKWGYIDQTGRYIWEPTN